MTMMNKAEVINKITDDTEAMDLLQQFIKEKEEPVKEDPDYADKLLAKLLVVIDDEYHPDIDLFYIEVYDEIRKDTRRIQEVTVKNIDNFKQYLKLRKTLEVNDMSEAIGIIDLMMIDPRIYVDFMGHLEDYSEAKLAQFFINDVFGVIEDVAEGYGDESWPTDDSGEIMELEDARIQWYKLKSVHLNMAKRLLSGAGQVIVLQVIEDKWKSELNRIKNI